MSGLTRDGTAEPVLRDQVLRRERGQGNVHFPCSADHVQDWQPYPVDPYSCYRAMLCVTIHNTYEDKLYDTLQATAPSSIKTNAQVRRCGVIQIIQYLANVTWRYTLGAVNIKVTLWMLYKQCPLLLHCLSLY